jgi:hypothetical protein
VQAARVLHPVLQRHPVVRCAPEAETRTRHAIEDEPWVGDDERPPRGQRVPVLPGAVEECLRHHRVEPDRVCHRPAAEQHGPQPRRTRGGCTATADDPAGAERAEHGHRQLADARRRRDPGRRREHERAHRIGTTHGGVQPYQGAEGVSDPRRGQRVLVFEDVEDRIDERLERRCAAQRLRAAVAAELRDDEPEIAGQALRHGLPVPSPAAQAVDEDEGPGSFISGAGNEIAGAPDPFGFHPHQGIFLA